MIINKSDLKFETVIRLCIALEAFAGISEVQDDRPLSDFLMNRSDVVDVMLRIENESGKRISDHIVPPSPLSITVGEFITWVEKHSI